MEKEMNTLCDSNTWSIQPLLEDRTKTKGRDGFIPSNREKTPGETHRKARYVAKGFSQIQGVDYDETYSLTTRFTSIRLLLQKEANENMKIHQLDVK